MFLRRRARRRAGEAGGSAALAVGAAVAADLARVLQQLAALDARLTRLEQRLADAEGATDLVPQHADVLDLHVRTAKLAAELHLVQLALDRLQGEPAGLDDGGDEVDDGGELDVAAGAHPALRGPGGRPDISPAHPAGSATRELPDVIDLTDRRIGSD